MIERVVVSCCLHVRGDTDEEIRATALDQFKSLPDWCLWRTAHIIKPDPYLVGTELTIIAKGGDTYRGVPKQA
jgi:hypothetical protein